MVAHEKNSSTDKQGNEKDFQQINKEMKKTLYNGVSQSRPSFSKWAWLSLKMGVVLKMFHFLPTF